MAESAETNISFLLAVGTIGILLPVISIIIFVIVYQKRLALQQLKLREKEAIHQKELFRTALSIQEKERSRIARDLHDGVIQDLTAVKHYLNSAFTPGKNSNISGPLLNSMDTINETIKNIRSVINGLLPSSLERNGLEIALKEMCMKLSEVHKIDIDFKSETPLPKLNDHSELMIYRTMQEIYSNIIRHSGASKIETLAQASGTHLLLEIIDNGLGKEIADSKSSDGIGLKSIDLRITALGASLRYHTEESKGTRVKIVIPLTTENE